MNGTISIDSSMELALNVEFSIDPPDPACGIFNTEIILERVMYHGHDLLPCLSDEEQEILTDECYDHYSDMGRDY